MNTKKYKVIMLPTEDTTTLWKYMFGEYLEHSHNIGKDNQLIAQHLYVISDEDIKEGDWYIYEGREVNKAKNNLIPNSKFRKIIATTNKSLSSQSKYSKEELGGAEPIKYTKLPQLPQSLIKHYAEVGGVGDIELKYELVNEGDLYNTCINHYEEGCLDCYDTKLKLTDNNEVVWNDLNICKGNCGINYCDDNGCIERKRHLVDNDLISLPIEKMYSRQEVESIILQFAEDCGDNKDLISYEGEIDGIRQYNDAKRWIKETLK